MTKGERAIDLLILPLILLPLGLDTLAVSLSLGIKSAPSTPGPDQQKRSAPTYWLRSALLFSLAETIMPLIGLLLGFAASLAVSNIMHYAGALLLIGLGAWELWEEGQEYIRSILRRGGSGRVEGRGRLRRPPPLLQEQPNRESNRPQRFAWSMQLLLALSVSLDELAVGFSLGTLPFGKAIGPLVLCLYIGIQGFVMTVLGITLGRAIRARLKPLKEASEIIGALLLIGLGIWVLFF